MQVDSSAPDASSRAGITLSITALMAIWAINFLVVKFGLRYLPALTFASFRVVAAGFFMLAIAPLCARLPIFRQAAVASTKAGPHSRRDYWVFFYLGFFGVAVNQLCFTIGLNHTNITHSSIIVGLAPIYTLTLSVL